MRVSTRSIKKEILPIHEGVGRKGLPIRQVPIGFNFWGEEEEYEQFLNRNDPNKRVRKNRAKRWNEDVEDFLDEDTEEKDTDSENEEDDFEEELDEEFDTLLENENSELERQNFHIWF